MFEKVEFLINLINDNGEVYYFFHKASKTLLPLEISLPHSLAVHDVHPSQPSTCDTLRKTLFSLGVKIKCIKIYLYQEENYYTYLSLQKGKVSVDINASLSDAIKLREAFQIPVLVEKNILEECGLKVTGELIEQALLG